jgi:putative transposase
MVAPGRARGSAGWLLPRPDLRRANAVADSFFASLEWELIEESDWHTHEEARRAVFDYLEVWYNRERLHSSLHYRTPAEYEDQLALTPRVAA